MMAPKDFKHFFNRYILDNRETFSRKTVVDMPAGTRITSRTLTEIGSHVLPFDLFPEYFKVDGLECRKRISGEFFRPSVSPKILVDGTLFVEFEKESAVDAITHEQAPEF